MSILSVKGLVDFPKDSTLNQILVSDEIDIVSPFYSGWALEKLAKKNFRQIRLITRLPEQYKSPPPFLDNDPRPLKRAMSHFGAKLSVFALRTVHAKLYISRDEAWLGSANFTKNGFSGKGELLIKVSPAENNIRDTFDRFLKRSTEVTLKDVSFLVDCLSDGIIRLPPLREADQESGDIPALLAVSYDDFTDWLKSQVGANYILDRISNKNRMSGHVYSGFHGLCAFFQRNPRLAGQVIRRGLADEDQILDHLKGFVERFGQRFGGPRGGTWNSKLSVRLGGTQSGGGAGDAVVKHLLPFVARYLRHKKLV